MSTITHVELNEAVEAGEETCELRVGGGWFGWRLHGGGRSEAQVLVAVVEARRMAMGLDACTLEQSERERRRASK